MILGETSLKVTNAVCNMYRKESNEFRLLHYTTVKFFPKSSDLEENCLYGLQIATDLELRSYQ